MKDNKTDTKKDEKTQEQNENKENVAENTNQDPTKVEENQEEKKEENVKEEEKDKEQNKNQLFNSETKHEEIYTEEKIKELIEAPKEKRKEIISQLYMEFYKKKGEKFKPNQLNAIFNFHSQSIEFILTKFKTYSIDLITKIANIFSLLLNLKEDEYNLQIKNIEGAQEDIYKPIPEPDFCYIVNKKLMEIKQCFTKFKLFPNPKEPKENKNETQFYLTNNELNIILSYLNECYFPFIRLFYHVINLNRIETKKINSTVNKPLTIVNTNDLDNAPEKFIVEEQIKRPVEKEKKIDEKIEEEVENKFDVNDLKNRQIELENKARNDYINEVRKLISEKVEELKKDVDAKISENGFEIERNMQSIKEQYFPNTNKKK